MRLRKAVILLVAGVMVAGGCSGEPSGFPVVIDGLVHSDADRLAGALDDAVVCLDGGQSLMGTDAGSADEGPGHPVTLDAFCIGKYEVTNAQYQRYVAAMNARMPPHWESGTVPDGAVTLPVVGVDWGEAASYCEWIGGRLPTEAEWERACRGEAGRTFPWGRDWDPDRVNSVAVGLPDPSAAWPGAAGQPSAGGAALRQVGSYPSGASPEGIHDLCGNAAEWVADWYDPDAYSTLSSMNPLATGPPRSHIVRGGAWLIPWDAPDLLAGLMACTARDASHVDQSARIGFRCAFTP